MVCSNLLYLPLVHSIPLNPSLSTAKDMSVPNTQSENACKVIQRFALKDRSWGKCVQWLEITLA